MAKLTCSSLKDSFLAYLAEQTVVHETGDECVVTVPMNTWDNRWVDVLVEDKGNDFFLVHDGGKSSDELFLQGVAESDRKDDALKVIASRYGVDLAEGRFMVGCNIALLQHSIWAVAHCSSIAMGELVRHKPSVEEEEARVAVGNIISTWALANHIRVAKSVSAKGETGKHTFDFIAASPEKTVAVNVLSPGQSSIGRAQRYGFQNYDIRQTYRSYKKLAVLSNPERWSVEAHRLVSQHASKTVDFLNPIASSRVITNSLESLLSDEAA